MERRSGRLLPRRLSGRPAPALHHIQVAEDGLRLAVTEWAPAPGPQTGVCVLLHATGFHARCWDGVIERLPASMRCYAIDARGHGRSDKPASTDAYRWPDMAKDAIKVLQHLHVEKAIGVGHSMGGWLALHAALECPKCFAGLVLVDPVVLVQERYDFMAAVAKSDSGFMESAQGFVARRFNRFSSPEHMYQRFRGKGPYKKWDDTCLADYCASGLLPTASISSASGLSGTGPHGECGGAAAHHSPPQMALACPPAVEAATYMGGYHNERHRYAGLDLPISILRASKLAMAPGDFSASPTDPELWTCFPRAVDVAVPEGTTHFIPMQHPELVARNLMALAEVIRNPDASAWGADRAGARSRL